MNKITLNSIEEAIEQIRNGKVIIVVDDDDRENEGDFVCAAECVTPEIVNFMATHGRGLICAPLAEERCDELGLSLMVVRLESDKLPTMETLFRNCFGMVGTPICSISWPNAWPLAKHPLVMRCA